LTKKLKEWRREELNLRLLRQLMMKRWPQKKKQEKLLKKKVLNQKKMKPLQNLILKNSMLYLMKTIYLSKFQRRLRMILITIST